MIKFDIEFEPERGNGFLVPTDTECFNILDDTFDELVLTVNRRGKIAPGGFFYFNVFKATGDVTIEVVNTVNPASEENAVLADANIYIVNPDNGNCMNISKSDGVTISIVGNVATIFVPEMYANQSMDNTLITKVHYKSPTGQAGTEFCFDTSVNGVPSFQNCVTVE